MVYDAASLPAGLVADWRDFVFLHFAVEPADLSPHVPYPLDLFEGRAYVSLVSFEMNRVRPARWFSPDFGRWLLRPISDHLFLNVRTYVRGPAGAGIHFIAEWIDNPISLRLGPLTYGLPYKFAVMERRELPGSGLRRIGVHEPRSGRSVSLVVPTTRPTPPRECAPGSKDAFLLERYVAYTHRKGKGRWFSVDHPRWRATPFQLARFDTTLFEAEYPWFRGATFVGGHFADGFNDIGMSLPQPAVVAAAHETMETAPAPAVSR